jgi:Co/Zn/Cd efflux system component
MRWVLLLNLGYFGIEFAVARAIGSVSLFADSIDFLEDASLNILIAIAVGWSARGRAYIGMLLAIILLAPALAGLWTAWQKLALPVPPAPLPLTLTGAGALMVNLCCASSWRAFAIITAASPRRRSCRRGTTCWPTSRSSPLAG